MDKLSASEQRAIKAALLSPAFQDLIGLQSWSLTEAEEEQLWSAIRKLEAE